MNHTLTITYIEYNNFFNITQFIKSPYKMITLSLLLFINLFIFASNLFMIIILLISKNKRFDATRKFLINLSIIDIQFALYIMPISIIYLILKMNWLSYYMICYLWIIIDIYFCTTNMFNLVIIAFDRMLAINYAVKYNQIMSPTRVRLLLLLIWLLALFIILPLIVYIIWYQLNISSIKKQNMDLTNSLDLNHNDDSNDSIQYKCSLIHVSIYIRLFISICSMYIPTCLMCYFYFHVFSKVIINKRGISIGLLIDNNNDYYRQSKKKFTSSNDHINKIDFNQTDNNNHNTMDNNKRNKCKIDKTLNYKNINNHSKYGLLRVHVGGKQLLCGNNTFINHKCNSTTNINSIHNNNNNNGNISQHVKLINNDTNDSTIMINTLPDNSTIQNQDDSYDQLRSTTTTASSTKDPQQQQQEQHSSLTTEFITSNILMKSHYTVSNEKSNDSNSINLMKPMDKLENKLSQSRRSTGRTDKHDKCNDIITLRRCALMPLNHNTPYSSINNEYMIRSNRNSENLSNLSTTLITPRNTFNPIIYGSASEDLRKAFKRFILHCGKIKHEKKALKRLVLAGLGAAGIPYGHRIIIPQQMKSTDFNDQQYNKSVLFNKPLMENTFKVDYNNNKEILHVYS
uniref:5-hydroxytryptamine receptor 2B n=1 Tax=Schistosoma haematobium TaxID=6185 RepID=A0A094ZI15_SCHHA